MKNGSEIKVIEEAVDFIVVDKPAGVLTHPTQAGEKDTLIDFVLKKYRGIKKVGDSSERPGIVHRLDKEASGLLVIARTQEMFEHLKKQFQDRTIEKEYIVLVYGKMFKEHGVIDFAIDRGKEGRMVSRPKTDLLSVDKVGSAQPGKEAITEYFLEKTIGRFSLLRVKIHTGRMHQIRAHMFAFNHPVVGDTLYLNRKLVKKNQPKLDRLFLHSAKLCFTDLAGEKKCFESELPGELSEYLKKYDISPYQGEREGVFGKSNICVAKRPHRPYGHLPC